MSRDIWTYWGGPIPSIVLECQESWKKYAIGWNIHFLNPDNIREYNLDLPSTCDQMSPQLRSDCIRMELLYKRGGLWMDASIMLHEDLSWLDDFVEKENIKNFTGFYFAGRMENWFMYVPHPEDEGISMLREEFFAAAEKYPNIADSRIYSIGNRTENSSYFVLIQTYFYLLETNPRFVEIVNKNALLPNGFLCVLNALNVGRISVPLSKYTQTARKMNNIYVAAIILLFLLIMWMLFGGVSVFIILLIIGLLIGLYIIFYICNPFSVSVIHLK